MSHPCARGADVAALQASALKTIKRPRLVRVPLDDIGLAPADLIPVLQALAPRLDAKTRDRVLLSLEAVAGYYDAIGARWDAARVRDTIFTIDLPPPTEARAPVDHGESFGPCMSGPVSGRPEMDWEAVRASGKPWWRV